MDEHREEIFLSPQERQGLANMWSALAAEDARLARRLQGGHSLRRVWLCVAALFVVFGLVLTLASPVTSLVLKSIGVAFYAAGVIAVVQLRS